MNTKINPIFFSYLNLLLPISVLLYLIGIYLFNFHVLENIFSHDGLVYLKIILVIGLPHIISSFLTFMDKEYLLFYKKKIAFAFIFTGIITYFFFHRDFLPVSIISLILFEFLRVYHTYTQQFSLLRTFSKVSSLHFNLWRYSAILTPLLFIAKKYILKNFGLSFNMLPIIVMTLLVFFISSILLLKNSKQRETSFYIYSSILIILCVLFSYYEQSLFLVGLIFKLIHDLSAFYIYITHDQNRNEGKPKNFIYAFTGNFIKLSSKNIMLINITLSLFIGFGISFDSMTNVSNNYNELLSFQLIIFFSILHYFIESFCWKKSAIHRKQIHIKA